MPFGSGIPADLATPPADGAVAPGVSQGKNRDEDQDRRHGRSPSQTAWDRLKTDKVAITCFAIVLFFVLVAIFAPLLVKLEGEVLNEYHSDLISDVNTYPIIGANREHWFGVEPRTGRDLFAIWAYGARPSLVIGFVCATLSTIVGITLGLLGGYLGGRVDKVIGWVIDLLLSVPLLLVVLAVVPVIQQRFTTAGGGS